MEPNPVYVIVPVDPFAFKFVGALGSNVYVTVTTGAFTVTAHVASFPLLLYALIIAVPAAFAVIAPLDTDAILLSDELHDMVLSAAVSGTTDAEILFDSPTVRLSEPFDIFTLSASTIVGGGVSEEDEEEEESPCSVPVVVPSVVVPSVVELLLISATKNPIGILNI